MLLSCVNSLGLYIRESRNLIRVPEDHRRHRLMRRGKLGIVSFLNDLPKVREVSTGIEWTPPVRTLLGREQMFLQLVFLHLKHLLLQSNRYGSSL